jgi:hypothetical protein
VLAPINRVPPEVLTLIPDFWATARNDRDLITLTHVCRAWREAFISRSSLWTDFDCVDADKTHVYLERSKSSPINLWLDRDNGLSPHDPFLQIAPHVLDRLKCLSINTTPDHLQGVANHFSPSVPPLEELIISGNPDCSELNPVLPTTLFNGDLSSLCTLYLESVRTDLPWRNMVNLKSFSLRYTLPGHVPIRGLLDFFENAPHLHKVSLFFATPTSRAQNGRLVSLACLKEISVIGDEPPSLLLDHLIIPVGAKLTTRAFSHGPITESLLPRSLDNLKNLPNFTDILLYVDEFHRCVQFSGPNGQVCMVPRTSRVNLTCLMLESLARFDTSKTERVEVYCGNSPSSDSLYQALLPMKDLHTLTFSRCASLDIFIHALDPGTSSSGVVVCPRLEEVVLELRCDGETLNIKNVAEMAAARASKGAKLKSVRIFGHDESMQIDASKLRKHTLRVECDPEVNGIDGGNVSDEEE